MNVVEKLMTQPAVSPSNESPPPGPLRCPLCGNALSLDPWWSSPHWLCPAGHSYSNMRVLFDELRERGWLPADHHLSGYNAAS